MRYERNPDFIFRQIVDEAVLVPIRRDVADMECIYTLSEVGALVWQALDRPATEAELQKAILDQFEADPEAVTADLDRFLRGMVEIDAIRKV
jgi:hypothetical protein